MKNNSHSGKKGLLVLLLSVLFLFAGVICWINGVVGTLALKWLIPLYLPAGLGRGVNVEAIHEKRITGSGTEEVVLFINAGRAGEILKSAFPVGGCLVPPGIIRDGIVVEGSWEGADEDGKSRIHIPLRICIDDVAGAEPVLRGRFPSDEANRIIQQALGDSLRSEEKWFLGTYEIIYELTFDTFRMFSEGSPRAGAGNRRELFLGATGKVRIKFEDNLLGARTTAKVGSLKGDLSVSFEKHIDGIGLSYKARITELKVNLKNFLEAGDEQVSESLRKTLEKSLNRKKNMERAAKMRLPPWTPLDLAVDISVSGNKQEKP